MSDGLRPRPAVPDEIRAAVQAAVDEVVSATAGGVAHVTHPWRFSGRWFSAHPIMGRPRPR